MLSAVLYNTEYKQMICDVSNMNLFAHRLPCDIRVSLIQCYNYKWDEQTRPRVYLFAL